MTGCSMRRASGHLWEIPVTGKMRVPGFVYATDSMMTSVLSDNALEQVKNVAQLPGIVRASYAMPDIHWGYGFPIGGVAAFDVEGGVVSPGGVGYDINCGVRLMTCSLQREDVQPQLQELMQLLFKMIPSGVGATGGLRLNDHELRAVALEGARWAVARGYGGEGDLEYIEEGGCMRGAAPQEVSKRAAERGVGQLGTLGSGNHFLEVDYVSEVYDPEIARVMGLSAGQIVVGIHCGSRGYGHQICDDFLVIMDRACRKYGIELPDRQLACAPIQSREGQAYLGAMRCAVNFAFANRQIIAEQVRQAFSRIFRAERGGVGLRTVYEIAHNIAKMETHVVDGRERAVCVHRKGATRAFPAGHREIPAAYQGIGQPVLIPGDMGRYSYVLTGTQKAMDETFGSTCHGAGRLMSRHKAMAVARGRNVVREMSEKGIVIIGQSRGTLGEEISEAYKDVAEVVEVCVQAGISRKVVQLRPLGCIKG